MTRWRGGFGVIGVLCMMASLMGMMPVGTDFYSKKFQNMAGGSGAATTSAIFGFTSKKVWVQTPSTNSGDVCISWSMARQANPGERATCPDINVAATNGNGMDRIPPGTDRLMDDMQIPGVTVIGETAGQTVTIRAWR